MMDLMYKYPTVTGLLALVGAYSVYKMYAEKQPAVGALKLNGLHMNGVHLNGVHKAGLRLNPNHYGALALNGLAKQ